MRFSVCLWSAALALAAVVLWGNRDVKTTAPVIETPVVVAVPASELPAVDGLVGASGLYSAKVVSVVDGDTIVADRKRGGEERIRLAAVDAPESHQAFGEQSKRYLSDLILNKDIQTQSYGTDRYGRTIAVIRLGNASVNKKIVTDGYAWFYPEYDNGLDYSVEQFAAQKERRGLWHSSDIIPPSLYRKLSTLGTFGESIIAGGLYLDKNGVLHNSRCAGNISTKTRWNGTDRFSNCPKCGGAIFD